MDWQTWLNEHQWESWASLAVLLGMAEILSLDLVLIMVAAGAAAGAISALAGASVVAQVLIASVVSVAMLVVVRPLAKRRLNSGPDLVLGHAKLVGHQGIVTEAVSSLVPGQIRVDGETWTAEPYDEHLRIAVGDAVEVLEIRGATAVVHPVARLEL